MAIRFASEALDVLEGMGATAFLTGSLAEDEDHFRTGSDIDILVTERPRGVTRETLYCRVSDLESPIRIDLIFLEDLIREHVRNSLLRKARDRNRAE
ncbi:nucleotidyltransferase domain-containing protein [Spiribacter halobius]|uniref:Polymerase nucleotidyl transferase domain-containing protein n=1 Tax=Sediminicurvatus halobius TaxID=2182432 RepID=A0A2U2MXC3_9GAMM|nr:nucleotidyltransferase domain-containing protein [Spiribacter halobius]PWG61515.1 hypothetical protein DEM34_15925 [Spiribacter halobius]UEX77994.1 nucleotidyltransferase domain-containing protein [Spiribacter halobius]